MSSLINVLLTDDEVAIAVSALLTQELNEALPVEKRLQAKAARLAIGYHADRQKVAQMDDELIARFEAEKGSLGHTALHDALTHRLSEVRAIARGEVDRRTAALRHNIR